jgi:hypothetical protein
MLFAVSAVKLVAEIALMALLGRWVLGAWVQRLAPHAANQNVFLWLLDAVARPFVLTAGCLTPRWVLRQHWPLVAFLLLLLVWVATVLLKIVLCVEGGMAACR